MSKDELLRLLNVIVDLTKVDGNNTKQTIQNITLRIIEDIKNGNQ